jgi:glucose-6-phosphate dehydrogenase assembly protein OpcA
MGPRVPSRTILLHPSPGGETRLDADVHHACFPTEGHETCAEAIRIWLRGETAAHPASVVTPLQIPDLPAFLRWRGKPGFASAELEQLVGVHDRLIVDSAEWGGALPAAYRRLAEWFPRIAVSDLAWARALPFRAALADRWPFAGKELRVRGPRADALLLRGWLRSRLKRDIRLRHEDGRGLDVWMDGERVQVRRRHVLSGGDMLSAELEVYDRDRVYEAAVRAV